MLRMSLCSLLSLADISSFSPSIREFTDLDTPVLMFDKDDKFVVLRIREVSCSVSSIPSSYKH